MRVAALLAVPVLAAAQGPNLPETPHPPAWFRYSAPSVSQAPLENSPRFRSLIRAGNVYLSLQDAIALALENNLDIEVQRYNPRIAEMDLMRAKGGGTLRGVPLVVNETPLSVTVLGTPLVTSPASGTIATSSAVVTSVPLIDPVTGQPVNLEVTPTFPFSPGPPIPLYDPALTGNVQWQHQETPQTNTVGTGTNSLIGRNIGGGFGYEQGFSPGTQIGVTGSETNSSLNSIRNFYNPFNQTTLGLTVTQPLLRGFGVRLNRRFIRIAKNDRKISSLVFEQQVVATVSGIINLYYDLVSLNEDVAVKRETLREAQRLEEDNRNQVEAGTLAPIELVRAQAQVATARQDLSTSEGYVLQQELLLKTLLTKRGTADPLIRSVRVIPTDTISVPPQETAAPVDELVSEAYRNRPEIAAANLQIDNSRISLEGSRNDILPQLDLVGSVLNSGLAGSVNSAYVPVQTGGLTGGPAPGNIGGVGTAVGQVFRGTYPAYSVGLELQLPLRNRIAISDMVRDELQVRQTEARAQQIRNEVRLEIENSLIALDRARTAIEAARQTVSLQQQSLELEQAKFDVGLSTTFLITQYEALLAQARSAEVSARSSYSKASIALERAMGRTLSAHDVSLEEAYEGKVSRAPSAIPGNSARP
ncbi:MAG TPA: TolC family protein [Bryobacteraceae bacterium]|nr:TolC family protein [Bryobacteraceae bacterium]